jgi:hypothetical protein
MRSFGNNQFIYSLLIVAMILRLPAAWDCLPIVENSTEMYLAKISMNMGARQSIDPLIYIYPTFYSYILLILYGSYYLLGNLIGLFPDRTSFAVEFLIDPTNFILLGRLVNLFLSVLTVYLIYRILEKYRGKFFAGVAATLACLSQCYIEFSGNATPDTILLLFSTLTVLFFVIIDHAPRWSYLFIQGLCCGLAIAAKYNAGVLIIGILIADYNLYRKYKLNYLKSTLVSIAGIAVGFFLTNPLWLVIPGKYLAGFIYVSDQMSIAVSSDQGINYIWEIVHLLAKEWGLGLVFIAGTIFVFWKQNRYYLPQLLVVLLTFLYVGSWQKKGLDYMFAIFPIWIIFGTAWLEYVYLHYFKNKWQRIILLALIFCPAVVLSLYHDILYLNRDTRQEASDWLIRNHQPGQQYCYDNYHYDLAIFDIDRYVEYGAGAVYLPAAVKTELEKYRTDKRNICLTTIWYQDSSEAKTGMSRYAIAESFNRRKDLKRLLGEGVDLLITNETFISTYQRAPIEQYPPMLIDRIRAIRDFYRQLQSGYKPIQIFKAGFWSKGPELKIYDLSKAIKSPAVN